MHNPNDAICGMLSVFYTTKPLTGRDWHLTDREVKGSHYWCIWTDVIICVLMGTGGPGMCQVIEGSKLSKGLTTLCYTVFPMCETR